MKLKCEKPISSFAVNVNLRLYITARHLLSLLYALEFSTLSLQVVHIPAQVGLPGCCPPRTSSTAFQNTFSVNCRSEAM